MVCMNPKIAFKRPSFKITDKLLSKRNFKRLNKLSFVYRPGWTQVELPCGECPACKLAKSNEWATRLECEAREYNHMGIFVTLTYNNQHLPFKNEIPTLKKQHMQNYKKRLRKYLSNNNETYNGNGKIRTFECGEYGPKTQRPHYHQIIFNWIPKDLKFKELDKRGFPLYTSKTLQKIWGNGFVIIGTISWQSASYVARYTMKKMGIAKQKRRYYDALCVDEETGEFYMTRKWHKEQGKIEPEFITMSNRAGIGANYFEKNFDQIIKNNGIMINIDGNVHLKPIPRYFRKLYEKWNWEEYERWKYKNRKHIEENNKKTLEQYELPAEMHEWQKENWLKNKLLQMQRHKFGMLKRENILYDGNANDNEKFENSLRYGAL